MEKDVILPILDLVRRHRCAFFYYRIKIYDIDL
jgi:hypothetical protein